MSSTVPRMAEPLPPGTVDRTRIRAEVGLRLRLHRHRAGLTQTQVAEALGASLSAVSMWETGNRQLSYENMLRIAALYRVSVGDFFEDDGSAAWEELRVLQARVASLEVALEALR